MQTGGETSAEIETIMARERIAEIGTNAELSRTRVGNKAGTAIEAGHWTMSQEEKRQLKKRVRKPGRKRRKNK